MEASVIDYINKDLEIRNIHNKILNNKRISEEDAVYLYNCDNLFLLAYLSDIIRKRFNGNYVYYNKNIHIEPTNKCAYNCKFCSYSAKISGQSWQLTKEEMLNKIILYKDAKITEVHITGGAYHLFDIDFYCDLFGSIKNNFPNLHIKALSAVEIKYLCDLHNISFDKCIKRLKLSGLNSIPGGGAEIFGEHIRKEICQDKASGEDWLKIHKTAHNNQLSSNATMLYGHIESYEDRANHLSKLRELQDITKGFNTFIPLKFKNKNNNLSNIKEVNNIEDLKNYAVSRIYLDNFPHIKAYIPMIGMETAITSIAFGVDDIDGIISQDTTQIYTMAGNKPDYSLSENDFANNVKHNGFIIAERDSNYNIIKEH